MLTASVVDAACVIAPLVNASAFHLSQAKVAAEQRAPTTAVDTDSAALTRTLSTTSVKPQMLSTDLTSPLIPKQRARAHGAFTGRGSSTSNAIAMQVTKVTTAHCANAPKVTIPKP